MDNALRSVVAGYLVHKAVGGVGEHRINWDAFDVQTPDGSKIEAKTSGYLQAWQQVKPSVIQFDIAKKDPWLANENRFVGDSTDIPISGYSPSMLKRIRNWQIRLIKSNDNFW